MQSGSHYIAYPTTPALQSDVSTLLDALNQRSKSSQADTATRLIQGAAHELVQTFFSSLLSDLRAAGSGNAHHQAEVMVREIDEKLTHYLGWASAFFGNDRIKPVVEHYHAMMIQLQVGGERVPHIAFPLDAGIVKRADAALGPLQAGQASSAHEGMEVMIQVIETALEALLITPKRLMKFNFVVDKTLNGVLSLTQTLAYRSLRKVAEQMTPAEQPVLAAHLSRLLVSASQVRAA